jgi:hypothetical protein
MSAPGCSCRMLQRIQYDLLLFIPSLLGRPIKCLTFKQTGPEIGKKTGLLIPSEVANG